MFLSLIGHSCVGDLCSIGKQVRQSVGKHREVHTGVRGCVVVNLISVVGLPVG